MISEKNTVKSWKKAATDLNIKIKSPFILKTSDGTEIKFDLLIENFGSKLGTVVLSTNEMTDFDIPQKHGFYSSALNPLAYEIYERKSFIETLTDWGFYGNEKEKPDWYSGTIYNE
ncbi:hypothetical protein [Thalassobellus citreus]|uniref:hypothetical protein n=1 Tax=Thalassobellus citreus TaxID=3367752 RepID=UPI0037B88C05